MKNKKVTINDLAVMVKVGFDGVDKRFEEAQKDRGKIREEVSGLREEMRSGFSNVNARFDILEKDIKEFVTHDEFEDLAGRVKYLETKLGIESGK